MLQITKIFHFEMAHAIFGYAGACKNLHGHSYELHVTVSSKKEDNEYLSAPGFVIDFKELKRLVKEKVIESLDHKMLVSQAYLKANPAFELQANLVVWPMEPTAENILLFIKQQLTDALTGIVILSRLTLYETRDSYAEWVNKAPGY